MISYLADNTALFIYNCIQSKPSNLLGHEFDFFSQKLRAETDSDSENKVENSTLKFFP